MSPPPDRARLVDLVEEHLVLKCALSILLGAYLPDERPKFARARRALARSDVRALEALRHDLARDILRLSAAVGTTRPFETYLECEAALDADNGLAIPVERLQISW